MRGPGNIAGSLAVCYNLVMAAKRRQIVKQHRRPRLLRLLARMARSKADPAAEPAFRHRVERPRRARKARHI